MKSKHVLLALILLTLFSCKKETALSPDEIISSHDWVLASLTRQASPDKPAVVVNYPTCTADDYYDFRPDNMLIRLEGPSRCNGSLPDVVFTSNWSLSVDKKTLTIGTGTNTLMKLTTDSMVYKVDGLAPEIRIIRYAKR